jgi:adenosylhomocysteine nucleosidase
MTSSPTQLPPASPSDASRADVGIVCALAIELAPFLKKCLNVRKYSGGQFVFRGGLLDQVRVAVVETGPGARLAERGTLALIDAHRPTWVISAGFSGGLAPEIQRNDVVVATGIRSPAGRELKFDIRYQAEPDKGIHVGRLLNTDRIVRTVEEKKSLATETGCLAVDMESFAVADACRQTGTRFLAVRSISDDLSHDLPPEAVAIFASGGVRRWGAVASSLWRRPSSASELWQLRDQAVESAQSLARFLFSVIEWLVPDGGAATSSSATAEKSSGEAT